MDQALDITVRCATNTDVERVRPLIYGVLGEYGLVPEPGTTDADIEDIEKNYLLRGGVFELLEDAKGNLLGTAGLYPMDPVEDGTVELRKMYFLPELRGQGWGKKTLTRMIDHARELGFKRIYLETASQLKEAIGLYKSFGFSPTCEGMHSERCDQAFFLEL